MKFIEITDVKNRIVKINPNHITHISKYSDKDYTTIFINHTTNGIRTTLTLDEIDGLLKDF